MHVRLAIIAAPACLIACLIACLMPGMAWSAETTTVWTGVYTADQATRGGSVYSAECSRCHKDDLSGYRNLLIGERFMDDWREDRLQSFFSLVKKTMPRNAPASLSDGEYLDVVAYILQANSFPAGGKELTSDALDGIRIEGRQGPQPVPNYALVELIGCLMQDAKGGWMLTHATEPRRTRNPTDVVQGNLKAPDATPAGTGHFRLLDADVMHAGQPGNQLQKNQKVAAKGFLMRKPDDDSINLTFLQPVGSVCPD